MIRLTEDKSLLGYGILNRCPGIFHFVTTRQGGYSQGNYASFNCSAYSGDDPELVENNRRRLLSFFPERPEELLIPYQSHGVEVRVIDAVYGQSSEEERRAMLDGVDALVTDRPGHCLCISTADCIPLLLFDRRNRAVAAVHAGWRGTVSKIVTETLGAMYRAYGTTGKDLVACIGPGISVENFEVGDEVYEAFRQAGFPMSGISKKHPLTGKWHIDLCQANRLLLLKGGLLPEYIELSGICTYREHSQFFSARRLGIRSGRLLSGIMLR